MNGKIISKTVTACTRTVTTTSTKVISRKVSGTVMDCCAKVILLQIPRPCTSESGLEENSPVTVSWTTLPPEKSIWATGSSVNEKGAVLSSPRRERTTKETSTMTVYA